MILARAHELAAENPNLDLAECVTRAGYELIVDSVTKSDETLGEWADQRLAALQSQAVIKSGTSYIDAARKVAEEHPGLLALRHCGVSTLPKAEAVVELAKAAASSNAYEREVIAGWLAELR